MPATHADRTHAASSPAGAHSIEEAPLSGKEDRLAAAIAGVVEAAGMELEEVSIRKAGRRSQVIVVVDGDVVDSDNLADLSRQVSDRLDEVDVLGDTPFTLEVTSRGVARPLTLPRHWRRNTGRLVQVHLADGSSVSGRITASDETTATVDDMVVPLAEVARAVVQVEFTAGGDDDGH